jgi:Bacterial regulatory proteins, luxR family
VIARRLGISIHTAKFHVASLLDKLDAVGRTDAVAHAARAFAAVPSSISVSLGSPSPVLHPPNYEPIVDLDEGVIVQVQTIVGQRLHRPLQIDADLQKYGGNPAREKALAIDRKIVSEEFVMKPRKILQSLDCGLDRCVVC